MIDIILFHWATYLFLAWLAVCVLGHLLSRNKPDSSPVARFASRGPARASSREDELELTHRER